MMSEKISSCPLCQSFDISKHCRITYCSLSLLRCRTCGLVFQASTFHLKKAEDLYDSDYFGHWHSPSVSESKQATYQYLLKKIDPPVDGAFFLDVGCALGYGLEAAEALGYEAWGVEFSSALAEPLRRRWGHRVQIGDFMEVPLPQEKFHVITLIDIIEHFPEPYLVLRRSSNLLKDGGLIILATPNYRSFVRKLLGNRWEQFKVEHLCYFSPENLGRSLEEIGFMVQYKGCFWKKLPLVYLLTTIYRYHPFLVPNFMLRFLESFPKLGNISPWLPTDEFTLIARKQT